MNKKLIVIILISSSFMGFCGYVFYQTFYKYQSDVDEILSAIPAEDKELPPNILKVFRNTRGVNNIRHFTTTNLRISANEKHRRIGNGEWHLFGVVWAVALPIRIGEKELFGYFANKVYFGKHGNNEIGGFKNAADFYFKKDLKDLSEDEVLVLLTIANNPSLFSHNRNSGLFSQKLSKMTEIYYKNSGK